MRGSNANSHLSVAPHPNWAKNFAGEYRPDTTPDEIKADLEKNLLRKKENIHQVIIKELEIKFTLHRKQNLLFSF